MEMREKVEQRMRKEMEDIENMTILFLNHTEAEPFRTLRRMINCFVFDFSELRTMSTFFGNRVLSYSKGGNVHRCSLNNFINPWF